MKKRLLILLFLLLSLSLCACGSSKTIVIHSPGKEISSSAVPVTSAPAQNPAEPSAEPTAAPVDVPTDTPSAVSDIPTQWYGWWKISSASGDLKNMYGHWWDCCAELTSGEDGQILSIWDEDMEKETGLAAIRLLPGSSPEAKSMSMLDAESLENFSLKLSSDEFGQLMHIKGKYRSFARKGGFSFEMILRPWGSRWDTGEYLPYYYKDWYLPLIEAGMAMPEKIGD